MTTLKASEVDRFLKNPDSGSILFLIYGPDSGLVAERADQLARQSGVDLSDPFSLVRLDAEVAADSGRLAEEAHTVAMFGGRRLIRVSGSTRRDLAKAVKPVLSTPLEDCLIVIEAGDLKKTSALRREVEKHPKAVAVPCYQDNDAAINQLIDEEILQKGLKLNSENRQVLKGLLGADRMISRSELAKLALYCNGQNEVLIENIRSVVGDASKLILDDIVDTAATGDIGKLEITLPKTLEVGNPPDVILAAVLRHFQMLQSARSRIDRERKTPSALVQSLRPPVHFSRKNAVVTALSAWPANRITNALSRLNRAMLECRVNSAVAQSIAGTTLLAIALEARNLHKRRQL